MTANSPTLGYGLHLVDLDARLELERGSAVVVIPVYGAHDLFVSCLRSVLAHTPEDVPILVADDASPEPATARFVQELAEAGVLKHRLLYLRQSRNRGFVENVNATFAIAAPADVVLVNSDCEVGGRWLELLRDAAYSDSTVATASALTNHGTILSVPHRNQPTSRLPDNLDVDGVAEAVARDSLKLRPRIPTAIGHCVYIRRSALDLVGGFDAAFSPGYGEEVDFSQRCALRGLVHVAADDVFVYHRGGGTFDVTPIQAEHEQLLAHRYPYYHQAVSAAEHREAGPLARSLFIARTAIEGLSVTIDARCLGTTITGTQIHVLELIHALARTRRLAIRAVVPPDINAFFRDSLAKLRDVEVISSDSVGAVGKTVIVHRPYQVFDMADLQTISRLGERFVVTHQDLISYRNPGYSRSFLDWDDFHRVTRVTLAVADYVLFFSDHAMRDALADDLVDESRAKVAHLGVDHRAAAEHPEPVRPSRLPELDGAPFVVCLGTNFRHKNRVFALRLLDQLQRRHRWNGWLVFAGPHAAEGTSAAEEAEFRIAHPQTDARTIDLHAVSEAEKAWLYGHTAGVVFPSVYEGFGLVPFEAADYGAPCFYAAQTSLTEILPENFAQIVQWDPAATADNVAAALADRQVADDIVAGVRSAAAPLTWDRTAERVLEIYRLAARDRDREIDLLTNGQLDSPELASRVTSRSYDELNLPPDVYRAFRAFSVRPEFRNSFFRTLRIAYAVGYRVKHRGAAPPL